MWPLLNRSRRFSSNNISVSSGSMHKSAYSRSSNFQNLEAVSFLQMNSPNLWLCQKFGKKRVDRAGSRARLTWLASDWAWSLPMKDEPVPGHRRVITFIVGELRLGPEGLNCDRILAHVWNPSLLFRLSWPNYTELSLLERPPIESSESLEQFKVFLDILGKV